MDRRHAPNILMTIIIALIVGSVSWFSYRSMCSADEVIQVRQRMDDHEKTQNEWCGSVNGKLLRI